MKIIDVNNDKFQWILRDIEAGKKFPHTRTQALINEKQLKDLKGWLINQKLDELGGKTMLEVAQ